MQTGQRDLNEKLPFKVKLSYGFSGYCSFITWTVFSYYGLYFMTENVGLSAAFAGAMISLGTLWDAITDPLVGTISDNIKNPKDFYLSRESNGIENFNNNKILGDKKEPLFDYQFHICICTVKKNGFFE